MKEKELHTKSKFKLQRYSHLDASTWNDFISTSKNSTFLFHRDFMDYHKECFEDFSLMIFNKDKLVALLPANRVGDELHSHQGLTYGGLLLPKSIKLEIVLQSFYVLLKFLHDNNIARLFLKEIPSIYHQIPSDEVHYLNFILKSELIRRDTLSVIDNQRPLNFSKSRLEGIKRSKKHELIIKEDDGFEAFWNRILKFNLKEKHKSVPVHSLDEILCLKQRFPNHIKQYNVYKEGEIVAGATIFESDQVAHCQYISGNKDKNILGSLDFLHDYLIKEVYAHKRYFDFGTSNEDQGQTINKGLQFWKEGFGARTLTQDFYKIETKNYNKLSTILK